MSKTNSIIALIEAGIKAESLRQKAIANNVANLETQDRLGRVFTGWKPVPRFGNN